MSRSVGDGQPRNGTCDRRPCFLRSTGTVHLVCDSAPGSKHFSSPLTPRDIFALATTLPNGLNRRRVPRIRRPGPRRRVTVPVACNLDAGWRPSEPLLDMRIIATQFGILFALLSVGSELLAGTSVAGSLLFGVAAGAGVFLFLLGADVIVDRYLRRLYTRPATDEGARRDERVLTPSEGTGTGTRAA